MSRFPSLDDFPEFDPGPAKLISPPEEPRISAAAFACFALGLLSLLPVVGSFTGIPAFIAGLVALARIGHPANRLRGDALAASGLVLGGLGFCLSAVSWLGPSEDSPYGHGRRGECANNVRQITLALQIYQDAYGSLPPAYLVDAQGRPTLSWRVAILPYLDAAPLYGQFHLDEPWDSPHNRALLSQMPGTFACPSRPIDPGQAGQTGYVAITGPGTAFPGPTSGRLADITDGTSNTLAVVESGQTVPWTKPDDDLVFDPSLPDGGLAGVVGSHHPGGLNALFLDGSVRFIKQTIAPAVLRSLATSSGGEVISPVDN